MHDADFELHMQIKDIDAHLERFERRAVIVLTSVLVLAVATCSVLLEAAL